MVEGRGVHLGTIVAAVVVVVLKGLGGGRCSTQQWLGYIEFAHQPVLLTPNSTRSTLDISARVSLLHSCSVRTEAAVAGLTPK